MKSIGCAGLCAALVLLGGCTAPAVTASTSTTQAARPRSPSAATTGPGAPTTPSTTTPARFGTTHRWPDGVSVKVTKPAPFWPSGWVREVNSFTHYVVVTVTIKNAGRTILGLSDLRIDAKSGGTAADPIHDPGKVGPAAPKKVATGTSVAFRVAWGVKKAADLRLQVSLSPSRTPALFGS